ATLPRFAAIVMYDAAGVRRAAGQQAQVLNQFIEMFQEDYGLSEDPLKELIGHTPLQVLVGSVMGAAVSWIASPAY
ncbi:MAG: divergent PAP2 family protein, partial [Coleofasciculaceae cyanobacterium SM2_3_26]|nr:divergent PAP2 family protein [Coleofasciculaceae cyanobacterium SM2_3_26]